MSDPSARPPLPELDVERIGPALGDRFPDVLLPDQRGVPIDVHDYRDGRRLLFVVHRSAAW